MTAPYNDTAALLLQWNGLFFNSDCEPLAPKALDVAIGRVKYAGQSKCHYEIEVDDPGMRGPVDEFGDHEWVELFPACAIDKPHKQDWKTPQMWSIEFWLDTDEDCEMLLRRLRELGIPLTVEWNDHDGGG